MISGKNKSKIIKRLAKLEMVAPSNEPFIVFIEQQQDNCYQVSSRYLKGKQKIEIETYKVQSIDDFYAVNPGIKCLVIVDDMGFDEDDEATIFCTLMNLVDETELDKLIDLLVNANSFGNNRTALDNYMHQLIKKYRNLIMETVGYASVDYSKLTTDQLIKLVSAGEETDEGFRTKGIDYR